MRGIPTGPNFSDSLGAGEIRAVPTGVRLREDYSAEVLRALARQSKGGVNQSRRLLSLARLATEWTEDRRQRSAGWIARRCAIGCIASTLPVRVALDNWTEG